MNSAAMPFPIPEIIGKGPELINALAAASGRLSLTLGGIRYRLHGRQESMLPFIPRVEARLRVGAVNLLIRVDRLPRPEVFRDVLAGLEDGQLAAEVLGSVLETLLEGAKQDAESLLGGKIEILEVRPCEGGVPEREGVDILLRPEADAHPPVRMFLMADEAGWKALAGWLVAAPKDAPRPWNHLPVEVRLQAGSVRLPRPDAMNLEPGDVVILDADPRRKGGIRITSPGGVPAVCTATWDDRRIIVEEKMAMDNAGMPGAKADGTDPFARLELELQFEFGSRIMSLGELREIAQGHIFLLPENPEGRVRIRMNGQVLGTGSLVKVAGQTGVRIESLWHAAPETGGTLDTAGVDTGTATDPSATEPEAPLTSPTPETPPEAGISVQPASDDGVVVEAAPGAVLP